MISCPRGLCPWGKGHLPSKLKMNWMSSGCQGIINYQFGSLMITSLPCSHMSSPARGGHCNLGPCCTSKPATRWDRFLHHQSQKQRTPRNTWHEITVNWIVLGTNTKKERRVKRQRSARGIWKTLVNLTMCTPTFSSLSHSTFPA